MATVLDHRDRPVPTLLRPDEVAEILQVTPRTVRRWGASGVIERVRLGDRLTRYTLASVEALIHPNNEQRPGSDPEALQKGSHDAPPAAQG